MQAQDIINAFTLEKIIGVTSACVLLLRVSGLAVNRSIELHKKILNSVTKDEVIATIDTRINAMLDAKLDTKFESISSILEQLVKTTEYMSTRLDQLQK